MTTIKSLTTGYSRGYVKVAERFIESEINIEKALKAHKNSNLYKCVKNLIAAGATKVAISMKQHAKSSQYRYQIFTGYAD
jgi:uncharacterized protein (DUF362 family)